jgi:two-component system OmpR family sensor kinase
MGVAVAGGRWATRRAMARIDDLIASAGRVDVDTVGFRLPVSRSGDELDDLTRALNSLLDRIDRGVTGQRRFAEDASHELRTPLTVMINRLEVARRRPRTVEEWERIVDSMLAETRRLAELSEALLQLSRVGADATAITFEVDALTRSIVDRFQARAAAAGLELVIHGHSDTTLHGDTRTFGIAVGNLIDNAIKYSPPGAAVTVRIGDTPAHVEIFVEDHGPGVPEHERLAIFSPFIRGHQARDTRGAGLGLSIVKRICESLCGDVHVECGEQGGARFVIRLPRGSGPMVDRRSARPA